MLGSCNSGREEIPINPESFTMTDLMGMSLDYLANDLRKNGRTFQDVLNYNI